MTTVAATGRMDGLDRLRGLAVVLMVVDHVLVLVAPNHLLRWTVTRAALPAFCLASGSLRRSGRRTAGLVAVALVEVVLGPSAGLGRPGIVAQLVVCGVVVQAARSGLPGCRVCVRSSAGSRLAVLVALGVVSATTWRIPWDAYQPGVVLALLAAGALVGPWNVARLGDGLPRSLGTVGRRPVAWYLGHLVVLALAKGMGS